MVRRALQPGVSAADVAEEFDTSAHTVLKWKKRYLEEGEAGLQDRSSRPHSDHPNALTRAQIRRIKTLRKRRWTMDRIARDVGCHLSTGLAALEEDGLEQALRPGAR